MLKRTHLAIGLTVALYFLPYVNNQWVFLPVVLIASLLPDLDSGNSEISRKGALRIFNKMLKHRGLLHTYTFCVLVAGFLAFFYPIYALPFFLGYSFHLLADSFTPQGIRPFWPFKAVSKGVVRTGGHIDKGIFWSFSVVSIILIITFFANGIF